MSEDEVVEIASGKIADLIRRRAGRRGLAEIAAIKRLCRDSFGIGIRIGAFPADFRGEVRGEADGECAVIYLNAAQPEPIQVRVLLHELAECLARRGAFGEGEAASSALAPAVSHPVELRHRVAAAVEKTLCDEIGIDRARSSWSVAERLRLFPLDAKYTRPRCEIERVLHDVII